jgi:hypothetical protein
MVRFERIGGASGVLGVVAIAVQMMLVGTTAPDGQALAADRVRWEWTTLLRIAGGLGIIWFTAGLAARLRRFDARPALSAVEGSADPAGIVLGAGVLWGCIWLVSGLFNSVAIALATRYADPQGVHLLTVLGLESILVLTPALSIAFLTATGVAILMEPTCPVRYAYVTLGGAAIRAALAVADWYGAANYAVRILDFTLLWVVVTGVHLLGATRPSAEAVQ